MAQHGMPHRVARAVGDRGEEHAAAYLSARGVRLVARNWRCAQGELDLVGLDHGDLVFYEVKTRRSARFGAPAEAVTRAKAARLRRLAGLWLGEHPQYRRHDLRIDVISVVLHRAGTPVVEHLQAVA